MKEINIEKFSFNPFTRLSKDWMLITTKYENNLNAMTASWGGFGFLWGKNVAYIAIRPSRFTKELIDNSKAFSLCFFDNSFRDQLNYFGKVSGRDENKIENSGLNIDYFENIPYFTDSTLAFFCKSLYMQNLNPECFLDSNLINTWYKNNDFHFLYVAEITNCFIS